MVLDPRELHQEFAVPLEAETAEVLLVQLEGFMDAARAGAGARETLEQNLTHRTVVTFDVDQLLDYRSRRPPMEFTGQKFVGMARPDLRLDLFFDEEERPFYLLAGPEPDFHWDAFSTAVRDVAEQLGVRLLVTGQGVPWAAPHTRPLRRFTHASRPELIGGRPGWSQALRVPGYAAAMLEWRFAESGIDTVSQSVQVPHYLSELAFPQASVSLLEGWADVSGLALPLGELPHLGIAVMAQVQEQVDGSPELQQAISELEHAYDNDLNSTAASWGETDIAEQVERFLQEIGDQGPPGESGPRREPGPPEEPGRG